MALNSKQLKVIPVLVGCDTIEGAARKTGIAKNTLYKWMKQEEFSREITSARKKLLEKAMNKLMNVTMKAVTTLEKLLNAESESVRRAAANDVLGHVLKYRELQEIEERLETLEKIVTERRDRS
ncbi:MAG: phBC6A51 family helix-turn-helix protein [Syntrophales bacterium]